MSIKRKIFICVLIMGTAYYCIQKASVEPLITHDRVFFDDRSKPIILWDIHNVIIKRDWSAFWSALRYFPHKIDIIRYSSLAMSKDMIRGLYDLIISGSTGEAFVSIALKHHNNALADFIIALANAQYIIPETAAIIRTLHDRGYTQHIGSNIGWYTFNALIKKPDMHQLFNTGIFDLDASQFGYYKLDNPDATIAKPASVFYQAYLTKNNIDPKTVLFIDDKEENVDAARKLGFYAIRFDNAAQLHSNLWTLMGIDDQKQSQAQLHESGYG